MRSRLAPAVALGAVALVVSLGAGPFAAAQAVPSSDTVRVAGDSADSAARAAEPAKGKDKKKGGLFGKVKGLAKNKVVRAAAKTAACTMLPGGQIAAAAIEAQESDDPTRAVTGQPCTPGLGAGAGGSDAGAMGAAAGAAAMGAGLGGVPGGLPGAVPGGMPGGMPAAGLPDTARLGALMGGGAMGAMDTQALRQMYETMARLQQGARPSGGLDSFAQAGARSTRNDSAGKTKPKQKKKGGRTSPK